MTEHLNIQIIKRRGSSPWPPGESRQALVKMLLFPSAIYSLLTCGSVFLDVWGNCHTLQMRSCFDAGISASAREEWYQLSGLFRLNEVALVPWTGIHFPLFPGWSVCTITLIRMNSNVFLTPIVLTVCGIFHSSGTSHYLAAQILWQRRSTPASQVYEWQRGLRLWPYTSKWQQSKSSQVKYDKTLRCDSPSLPQQFWDWVCLSFSPHNLLLFSDCYSYEIFYFFMQPIPVSSALGQEDWVV